MDETPQPATVPAPAPEPQPEHQTMVLTDPPPEKHHTLLYALCVVAVALVTGGIVYAYWQFTPTAETPADISQEEFATTTSQTRKPVLDQQGNPNGWYSTDGQN